MVLQVAYNFDEASGDVLDLSGNGRSFTPSAQTVRTAGHTGQGLTQTTAAVTVGPPLTGLQTANRTVMAWVKQSATVTAWALEMYVTAIDSGAWGILYLNGQIHIQARNAGGFARATAGLPGADVWHHIAGTYDAVNIRLYIDGVLAATTPLAGPLRADADVFRVLDQTGTSTVIDDVRLYDTALDAGAIVTDMNTPVGAPSGGTPVIDGNTLQYHMNRKAGTLVGNVPTKDAQEAANIWAGTTNLDLVAALNVQAGNVGYGNYLELAGVLNQLAGTQNLDVDGAAASIP